MSWTSLSTPAAGARAIRKPTNQAIPQTALLGVEIDVWCNEEVSGVSETLLTVQEAADVLNISAQTLRRMVWAREISYINLGNGPYIVARFRPEHIKEFLESREVAKYA